MRLLVKTKERKEETVRDNLQRKRVDLATVNQLPQCSLEKMGEFIPDIKMSQGRII